MNILFVHNSYQLPGGEDRVFQMEVDLLESQSHHVVRYQAHNDDVKDCGAIRLLAGTVWNRGAYAQVSDLINVHQIDLVHVHNTFPLISPSVYYAAAAQGVPVVQTLHNYRLLCPAATFYRDGRICEDCLGRGLAWPGIVHSCYRGSRAATAASAFMAAGHRAAGTWANKISAYIALTEFARAKFIAGGFPAEKIFVKPNFVEAPARAVGTAGGFAFFMGRLTAEKGVGTLLQAWKTMETPPPLEIAGDGPLAEEVARAAREMPNIRWHGWLPREQLLEKLAAATAVIVPSEWYEPFGLTVVEAFAAGVPVIASDAGSLASMVSPGRTGLLFRRADAADLARQVKSLFADSELVNRMRAAAVLEYEAKYTAAGNYRQLMTIYRHAGQQGSLNAAGTDATCSVSRNGVGR